MWSLDINIDTDIDIFDLDMPSLLVRPCMALDAWRYVPWMEGHVSRRGGRGNEVCLVVPEDLVDSCSGTAPFRE